MAGEDCRTEFDESLLGLATQNEVDTVAEIGFGLICRVRAVGDDDRSCILAPRAPVARPARACA